MSAPRTVLTLGDHLHVRQVTRPCAYLTAYDLAEIAHWAAAAAQRRGITRVEVHDGLPPDVVNNPSYVTVHPASQELPSHGLVRRTDGYHVWRMPSGEALGAFTTLAEALAAILPIPD
ncbi:MAG: hypothetical protein INR62_08260 [Rhodospirillales bacterium]|nr:hypothetical protein [Acetobacter sp.]